jgi:Arc/MetJ-type ribon-helix-helix transcriptional regulator
MNRHNFYVDEQRMAMLRRLAKAEVDVSVSDLVREAIDMIIADRMNNPRVSAEERRAKFDAFMARYAGSQPDRDAAAADEALVDQVAAERKSRRKRKQLV